MKILINTASSYQGGGVQVCMSFIEECKKFPENEYHVVLGIMPARLIKKEEYPSNFSFYEIGYRPATKVFTLEGPDTFLKKLEKKVKPDCVFSVGGPSYWRPAAPHLMGYVLPHYVYPESPFFKRISLTKRLKWYLKGLLIKYYITRDADAYVVQTDDVKERLAKWIGKNQIYTVTNTFGAHYQTTPAASKALLPEKKPGEFRFLMLSAYYLHKNFEIISEVTALLQSRKEKNIKFVLTLPDDIFQKLFSKEAQKFIYNLGPVKPAECPALYRECDAVFLPTLLECFSATYVEGMLMEKPILTSDMGFAHTVCRDAALYFNPLDAKDIVTKMENLVNSPHLRQELKEKGRKQLKNFNSAEERAGRILEICGQIVGWGSR